MTLSSVHLNVICPCSHAAYAFGAQIANIQQLVRPVYCTQTSLYFDAPIGVAVVLDWFKLGCPCRSISQDALQQVHSSIKCCSSESRSSFPWHKYAQVRHNMDWMSSLLTGILFLVAKGSGANSSLA